MGTKSVRPVPTVSSSFTTTYTTIFTTRFAGKTVTVTAKPVTRTSARTITITSISTAIPQTSTSSIKTTKLITSSTTLVPATFFVTVASTAKASIASTINVPTAAGFFPIQDTLGGAFMASNIKRNIGGHYYHEKRATTLFPQKVQCAATTFVPATITITKAPTKTASGSTKTVTTVKTVKIVSTKVPAAVIVKSTLTITSTVKKTSTPNPVTLSTTTTVTNTAELPVTTVYDACADNNFADSNSLGDYFVQVKDTAGTTEETYTVDNAYECCSLCFSKEDCAASYVVEPNSCHILTLPEGSTCSTSSPCSGFVYQEFKQVPGYTLINGPAIWWDTYGN